MVVFNGGFSIYSAVIILKQDGAGAFSGRRVEHRDGGGRGEETSSAVNFNWSFRAVNILFSGEPSFPALQIRPY